MGGTGCRKSGSCSGGQSLLSKPLIQLSAREWGCTPSLLFGPRWPSPGVCRVCGRANGDFQEDLTLPRSTSHDCRRQCPHPHSEPLPTPTSGDLRYSRVGLAQCLVGSLLLCPWSWWTQGFVCALQEPSLLPQSCGSPAVRSHRPSMSDSLASPSPFPRCPGWESWSGPRTFTALWELLWYYCSPVWGSSAWWLWEFDFIVIVPLLPSRYSFSVGPGVPFFEGFQHPFVNDCSKHSCDFLCSRRRSHCCFLTHI